MKENWEDNQVIDLFLDSDFNFVASNKPKAERVKELISQHKSALNSNVKIVYKFYIGFIFSYGNFFFHHF